MGAPLGPEAVPENPHLSLKCRVLERVVAKIEEVLASYRSWAAMACEPTVVRRSIRIAALVGTLLVLINYSDRTLSGELVRSDAAKIFLTCCVPYCVATYAAVQAMRQAEED
jgi:hypothetical protein